MAGVRCQVSGVRWQVSGVRCQVAGVRCQVSGVRCLLKALGRLLGASETALGCSWVPLEGPGTALGSSWKAFGRFLEASKRHLGPKTVKARFFGRFLKKNGNFGRPSWRRFNIKNRIF